MRSRERDDDVATTAVLPALRSRLGTDASDELVEWMRSTEEKVTGTVMTACADSFQLSLTGETSSLRTEIHDGLAAARVDTARLETTLRREMSEGFSALQRQFSTQHSELMKWAFLFWVGQGMWTAGVVVGALRLLER